MTMLHADFDHFPQLVQSLAEEFGNDGLTAVIERFVDAETADLHWDGRVCERRAGASEMWDDDQVVTSTADVIGVFRGRYFVGRFQLDAGDRMRAMTRLVPTDNYDEAVRIFAA